MAAIETTQPAPVQSAPKKKTVQLANPERFKIADSARNVWACTAEEGTTPEDVVDPSYFAILNRFRDIGEYDRIEVTFDSGEWFILLLVLEKGMGWMRVKVLQKLDLLESDRERIDPLITDAMRFRYEVLWKGPVRRYIVVRKTDRQSLSEHHQTRRDAERWIDEYEVKTQQTRMG